MILFPAIDLFRGCAVRLLHGEYEKMTVYNEDPLAVARDFAACGATHMHMVDLEGARDGATPNLKTVASIAANTSLFIEVGGGIRTMDTARRYIDAGVKRIILGTAAVEDRRFLTEALDAFGDAVAVGVDIRDGRVAVKGWTESSELDAFAFCRELQELGVSTVICTDISRDGAMRGTNRALYRRLQKEFSMQIIASGGVSSIEDVAALREMELYGAIIGRAYYTGAIELRTALEVAK